MEGHPCHPMWGSNLAHTDMPLNLSPFSSYVRPKFQPGKRSQMRQWAEAAGRSLQIHSQVCVCVCLPFPQGLKPKKAIKHHLPTRLHLKPTPHFCTYFLLNIPLASKGRLLSTTPPCHLSKTLKRKTSLRDQ